jgi:hypothetical protein
MQWNVGLKRVSHQLGLDAGSCLQLLDALRYGGRAHAAVKHRLRVLQPHITQMVSPAQQEYVLEPEDAGNQVNSLGSPWGFYRTKFNDRRQERATPLTVTLNLKLQADHEL